jgi:hypothetical protein
VKGEARCQHPSSSRPKKVITALAAAGVIAGDNMTRRVVIGLKRGRLPVVYVEQVGGAQLLDVALALAGIEVSTVEADAPWPPATETKDAAPGPAGGTGH